MDGGGVENRSHDNEGVPVTQNGVDYGAVADSSLATEHEVSDGDLNFSSKDISKREKTKFFTRVEGSEKRAREEERKIAKQERELRERMLKEAEKKDSIKTNVQERAENENLRETKHIKNEFKQRKIREFIWKKRIWILASIAIIIVAILAVIFVPKIIESIERSKKEQIIAEEKTDTLTLYEKLVDKEFSREELERLVENEGKEYTVDYNEDGGGIINNNERPGIIYFSIVDIDGKEKAYSFIFNGDINGERVEIAPVAEGKYIYYKNSFGDIYDSASEAIDAYLLEKAEEGKW